MASEQTITIKLVANGNEKSKKSPEETLQDRLENALHPIRYLSKNHLFEDKQSVIALQAIDYAKEFAVNAVNYSLNRVFTLREDYFAENTMNNVLNVIHKASSLGATVAAGTIAGAGAGPAGAIAGAIVSTIGWTVNEAILGTQKFDQQEMRIAEMNYGSTFSLARMGLNNNGRGTEN